MIMNGAQNAAITVECFSLENLMKYASDLNIFTYSRRNTLLAFILLKIKCQTQLQEQENGQKQEFVLDIIVCNP